MMKRKIRLFLWCISLGGLAACSKPVVSGSFDVIPLPQEVVLEQGEPFVFDASVHIVYPEGQTNMKRNADFLAAFIQDRTGRVCTVSSQTKEGKSIFLQLDSTVSQPEGYEILVNRENVYIKGASEEGIFYGIQTFRKALPLVDGDTKTGLPAAKILDYPRFRYRGVLLDVGRHYFPVEYIKQFIDMLALHHINYFHWHLTEDQGWRIEIKKYPKLTEIGSRRKETITDWETKKFDGKPYEGYYTQEEVKEIVAYAAERYITVIPEIDLPGHMLAALASYPELGCTGGPYEVATSFGVFQDVLCAGNERSLQFAKDVLEEVMSLFPAPYIHIGGDECPKDRWKKCPKCQALIRKAGLKGDAKHSAENRLQTYFMTQVEEFIHQHGRRMIGWDEVLEGGLTPDATIMSWRGTKGGIQAARQQHDVIMTPIGYLYFSNPGILKKQGLETVERVYGYEPVPKELNADEQKYVIGGQVAAWTEWIRDSSRLEYVMLPRLAAAAEILWTKAEKKEIGDFLKRLPGMLELYTAQGYEYRQDIWAPLIRQKVTGQKDSVEISCRTLDEAPIYYTIDGTLPTEASFRYTAPFRVSKGTEIKALTVREGKKSEVQTLKS